MSPTRKAAYVTNSKGIEVKEGPIPEPADNEILIKVYAAAANPTDWKHKDIFNDITIGTVCGCDAAGIVVKTGSKVTSAKPGDRVSGMVHGCYPDVPENGAFAEYALLTDRIFSHIPENVSFEEASSWGVKITTISQALYINLGLPLFGQKDPNAEGKWFLVWSGATSVGQAAVQAAALAGYKVVATASPHSFDLVKKLGATAVLDYHDSDVAEQIRKLTNDSLELGIDTISEDKSIPTAVEAFGSKGGKLALLLPYSSQPRKDVELLFVLAYTSMAGHHCRHFGKDVEPEMSKPSSDYWEAFEKTVFAGKYIEQAIKLNDGGLNAVSSVLDAVKTGKVPSGYKAVVKIAA
ncbi:hypothetical protein CANCADRAFT_32875 [Tortispora caseinolytica NRRL Y-17796]|uniref:Enoyl reductase (ER) domain-containing protein n=1 Tax=Tortispora caseinolytica NRRL Y-17796 TaxID=767744 RepID=A0A1E4TD82_9ASCO|nr:hypothetical protein CANCADRAFT_32875 [Tortispora caseinolytica NRRL Y-17796]